MTYIYLATPENSYPILFMKIITYYRGMELGSHGKNMR